MSVIFRILCKSKFLIIKKIEKKHQSGVSGEQHLSFAGSISDSDMKIMSETIDKDCGRVDQNEWRLIKKTGYAMHHLPYSSNSSILIKPKNLWSFTNEPFHPESAKPSR